MSAERSVLVLGGTRFIGRHIVMSLLDGGYRVSVFTRGQSPDDLPAEVERLHGNRDAGPSGLAAISGTWDACIDVSGYTPTHVRPSAELLRDRVGRYVFVSTVSVYALPAECPVRETNPLLPAADEATTSVTAETYGPLKVACERIVSDTYGTSATILRPQIVAGPWDPTGRFTYWVQRTSEPGEMIGPGDGDEALQVVDARDIAAFARHVIERDIAGVFNMAGQRITWRAFIDALGARRVTWVPADVLFSAGLTSAELPMYVPKGSAYEGVMDVSHERATAAGFVVSDIACTIADTAAWLRQHAVAPALTPERERDILAQYHATR